jgi:protein O-GlcNAc transferase
VNINRFTPLKKDGNSASESHNQGVLALKAGRVNEALGYFHRALEADPARGQHWISFVKALITAGHHGEAQEILAQGRQRGLAGTEVQELTKLLEDASASAVVTRPAQSATRVPDEQAAGLLAMLNAGKFQELMRVAREMTGAHPNAAFGWLMLSASAKALGDMEQSLAYAEHAVGLEPGLADAHGHLASVWLAIGRDHEAELSLQNAARCNSTNPHVYFMLGQVQARLRRLALAELSFEKALAINPEYLDALISAANLCGEIKAYDRAVDYFRRVLKLMPNYVEVYERKGDFELTYLKRYEDAMASFAKAIELKPESGLSYLGYGRCCFELERLDEARDFYARGVAAAPDYLLTYAYLGSLLDKLGDIQGAEVIYRQGMARRGDCPAGSALLFMQAYKGTVSPAQYIEEAQKWANGFLTDVQKSQLAARRFSRMPRKGRRLKVGYISGDFYNHAVTFFIEKVLQNHDARRMQIYGYSTNLIIDEVTHRIRRLCEKWTDLTPYTDEGAWEMIDRDQVDLLIDLTGHTANNRIGVFARRAAPVQAHYLGYFASTGLSEMDYWIADETLIPSSLEQYFTEKVWRLPRVWVAYQGHEVVPLPSNKEAEDGVVWLGSFNALGKLTPQTLALWSRIMLRLPQTKLLLKTKDLVIPANRERIEHTFKEQGVEPSRLKLISYADSWMQHMEMYSSLDIALDPIGGVGGGTTTCDALWMGLPLVTLAGNQMAQRMTASMLTSIGNPEWVASTEDEYVQIVASLVTSVDVRKFSRPTQREKMRRSALCDAKGLATALEDAYEAMYDTWWANHEQVPQAIVT